MYALRASPVRDADRSGEVGKRKASNVRVELAIMPRLGIYDPLEKGQRNDVTEQ